jgi:hypothetical protein
MSIIKIVPVPLLVSWKIFPLFFLSKEEFLSPSDVRKKDTPTGHGKTQQPEHH